MKTPRKRDIIGKDFAVTGPAMIGWYRLLVLPNPTFYISMLTIINGIIESILRTKHDRFFLVAVLTFGLEGLLHWFFTIGILLNKRGTACSRTLTHDIDVLSISSSRKCLEQRTLFFVGVQLPRPTASAHFCLVIGLFGNLQCNYYHYSISIKRSPCNDEICSQLKRL